MNRLKLSNTLLTVGLGVALSGCTAYDKMSENVNGKMADLYTNIRDGSKDLKIEDTPNAKKMTLNIHYRLATGNYTEFTPPKLTGDISYKESCSLLTFKVDLKNGDNDLITTRHFDFGEYEAGSKRMFDEDVHHERGSAYSDKVRALYVHGVECHNRRG